MLDIVGCTILAIAPHVDDVELGAGASIHRLAKRNSIHYLGLSLPPLVEAEIVIAEFRESCRILGIEQSKTVLCNHNPRDLQSARGKILQLFYDLNADLAPDIVLVTHGKDIHQSHEIALSEAKRAFKRRTILGYELPWNCMEFDGKLFLPVDSEDIEAKAAALACFKSQQFRHFFKDDITRELARVRGAQIEKPFAECFEVVRMVL